MKQKYTYAECYRILTLNPGCTWDALRKTYKQQIQKWHPDRFADNTEEKSAADEKIKHITAAYQQLAAYHRKHNSLPDVEPPRLAPRSTESSAAQTHTTPPPATGNSTQSRHKPVKPRSNAPIIFSLGLLGLVIYLMLHLAPQDDFPEKTSKNNHVPDAVNEAKTEPVTETNEIQAINEEIKAGAGSEKFITYGSSVGEVISIQGVPTHQDGDVWYYGDSEVYFRAGVVVGWKRAPNSSLKVGLLPVDKQDITKIPLEAPN
jgi:hypothetical protein